MLSSYRVLVLPTLVALSLVAGCGGAEPDHDDHDHDHVYHRLTVWDGELEAFARFELHEGSGRIEGTLYLTFEDEPIPEPEADEAVGWIRLGSGAEGDEVELDLFAPGRAGFELFFGDSDRVPLVVGLRWEGEERELTLGEVDRYAGDPMSPEVDLREYEKESQWRLGFAASETERRTVAPSATATGRVAIDERYALRVSAPVDGEVAGAQVGHLPTPGSRVSVGAPLVRLSPTLTGEGSWVAERTAYLQARDAFERAERLREVDAISLGEFQSREREYEQRRAGYEGLTGELGGGGLRVQDEGDLLRLSAGRTAVVTRLHVGPGTAVRRGDLLLELHDPDRFWLDLLVHADELDGLGEIAGVEVELRRGEAFTVREGGFELLGREGPGDAGGIRVRLTVALNGGQAGLRLDQPVRVTLLGRGGDDRPVVPRSAVFDEHSHKVVFVQHSGDQFERRMVRTGTTADGWTVIVEGLEVGERVVTDGVYPLHLATADIQIDHGHEH
ncbi:MAG: HlyD family efflux transporter periplasmic adaptor subunit [Gemmatimonadales bacterium]|nr:MAG: HlyD family efflux transporter periplasmic adaptor subunit [Gemmatimonadales bacterium]